MRKIAILGTTGSIGTQTLSIVREKKDLEVVSMSCGSNIDLFEEQIREFNPKLVSCGNEDKALELKKRISDLDVEVLSGMDGLIAVATIPEAEIVVTAIVGMLGIRPTVAAINEGKDIALANKETLVTAGHIIMPLSKEKNISILPVDSEHSAIFQSLQGNEDNNIHKILLTASGGPFRGFSKEQLEKVTLEDALKHPNWEMGKKITIDSATMVNKGLEVMEAKWLFGVDLDRIEVVVHPQSILHSAVEYDDGAVVGQLGLPDMRLPIQYALYYPKRLPMSGDYLDLFKVKDMTFEKPDLDVFVGLKYAYEAQREGGNMPTIFNAANEKAVALFLNKKISFTDIYRLIDNSMKEIEYINNPTLDEILYTESEVYKYLDNY
ncbi:MAG: 1-deoxy-D-xylulose-5-phosphate reductoisomerase [Lachnospiraceae bacterium]|nr:1-deoxy-D-xylulose-5-phosphate reductoisomerase [Lachnospiraceae bacterium]